MSNQASTYDGLKTAAELQRMQREWERSLSDIATAAPYTALVVDVTYVDIPAMLERCHKENNHEQTSV
jgi:hypothetical protein